MIPRRYTSLYPHMIRDLLRYLFDAKLRREDHVAIFEKTLADYLGVKEVITTATGREGMALVFDGLGLVAGDEVLIPAYTLKELLPFFSKRGLLPVPVDIEASTFNIDPARIEEAITGRTKALMITHMFGLPCDMNAMTGIVQKHGLLLIEDCAHALGSQYKGKRVGTFGDANFFSFELTKPINTFGGGAVATNNIELAASIRKKLTEYKAPGMRLMRKILFALAEEMLVRSPFFFLVAYLFYFEITQTVLSRLFFGFHGKTRVTQYRYSRLQAFLGRRWMTHLDDKVKTLNRKASYLSKRIGVAISLQTKADSSRSTRYFFVGTTPLAGRDARRYLLCRGIDVGIHEEITDDCASELSVECPVAEWVFEHALQIPLNVRLSKKKLDRIGSAIVDMSKAGKVL